MVLLAVFHRSEFATMAGRLTQDADIFGWDKAAFQQANTEQVSNPFGVLGVIFISLRRFDPLSVIYLGVEKTVLTLIIILL